MDKCKNAYNPSKVSMYIDSQKNKTLMDNYYTIDEINDILDGKIDLDSVYTKDETYNRGELYTREEVEYLLSLKANKVDVYSKIDSKTLLDLKANKNEIYDKNEIDEILDGYYTKLDIDTILENKADIEDVIAISGQVLTNIEDIEYLEANKQDKLIAGDNITISGNVISADLNDYLKTEDASNTYETIENVQTLNNTVNGHIESNLHLTEGQRTKLEGIAAGAEVNVNADWNATTGDAQILNKPNTLSGYGITDVPSDDKIYGRQNGEWSEIVNSGGGGGSIISITWSDLKSLRDAGTLVPGQSYRITDYVCTTTTTNSQAVNNLFDIVVIALDESHLSENASATYHAGVTYFANAKLEAWEIKYCIDNDTSRFAWANTVNGKGVIYRMIDEFNNDVPYDFKNIQFKKSNVFLYTFGGTTDNSLTGDCHNNTIMDYISSSILTLNFNTFGSGCYSNTFDNSCRSNTFGIMCSSNTFGYGCSSNTFGNDCYYNTFGDSCNSNTFGIMCRSNTFGSSCSFNTFGDYCTSNKFGNFCASNKFGYSCNSNEFGDECYSNKFGYECYSNTFGDGCQSTTFGNGCRSNNFAYDCNSNTFGNRCYNNTFGNECNSNTFSYSYSNNTFGNSCVSNTFGNSCVSNTFGNYCVSNTFGNYCYSNTFGNECYSNNFYTGTSGATKKDYIRYIVLEDGCSKNNFYSTLTTSSSSYLQRIRIKGLENDTPTNIQITLSEVNTKYEWVVAKNSSSVIKQYCPENLVP